MNEVLAGLVAAAAVLLSALGGWPVTAGVLRLAARSSDAGSPATGPADAGPAATGPADAALTDPDRVPAARATAERPGTGQDTADDRPEASDGGDGPVGPRARAALRGGTWIGILERTAVTGAVLLGQPTAVAVVVAVKGLGRYPELREHPVASERFVIGTLASLLWAGAVGALGRALLG